MNRPSAARSNSFAHQGQAEPVLSQEMGGVDSKQIKEARIGKITAEPLAGPWPVVVDPTAVLSVSFLQENAALVIGMNHENLACCRRRFDQFIHGSIAQLAQTDRDPDMSSHFTDKIDLVRLQGNLAIGLAAGATLSTF